MNYEFFDVPGDVVYPDDLIIPKARDLAKNLSSGIIIFARLVECRRNDNVESVIFEVDVEVPQVRRYLIDTCERLSATFCESDSFAPFVNALRKNFPIVPHLNLHIQEFPRNLCLYEEPYYELKRDWTPVRFIGRVRDWLAQTAKGTLHKTDQPLEPILIDYAGYIVLPDSIQQIFGTGSHTYLTARNRVSDGKSFILAHMLPKESDEIDVIASIHRCLPKKHGVIHRKPTSLADLSGIISSSGLDLLAELRHRLVEWKGINAKYLNLPVVLVIQFPKLRDEQSDVETIDTWAFFLEGTVELLGVKLDIWQRQDNKLGIVIGPDPAKTGSDIGLEVLNVLNEFKRPLGAYLNGGNSENNIKIAAVGVGALGSQVILNLARCGFGRWTLIDHDLLLPHNIARHALDSYSVGYKKADTLAIISNMLTGDNSVFKSLPANVLSPGAKGDELLNAFKDSDVILDMSASVAVGRYLASDVDCNARRLALFMSPSGCDLVMILEDEDRTKRLDLLEMQYYRAIINNEEMKDHFTVDNATRRYGRSCRDITSTLPQWVVALHSALGSEAIKEALKTPDAKTIVWRADHKGNVRRVDLITSKETRLKSGEWTIVYDSHMIDKVNQLREDKLPNETGGILLGSYDLERKMLYIVDVLPSPPDSQEWPTLYIRGSKGLFQAVKDIENSTIGMLRYIGEWHSHPRGSSTMASHDDYQVFKWLTNLMMAEGLPAVMMIVGDRNKTRCYVGELKNASEFKS